MAERPRRQRNPSAPRFFLRDLCVNPCDARPSRTAGRGHAIACPRKSAFLQRTISVSRRAVRFAAALRMNRLAAGAPRIGARGMTGAGVPVYSPNVRNGSPPGAYFSVGLSWRTRPPPVAKSRRILFDCNANTDAVESGHKTRLTRAGRQFPHSPPAAPELAGPAAHPRRPWLSWAGNVGRSG